MTARIGDRPSRSTPEAVAGGQVTAWSMSPAGEPGHLLQECLTAAIAAPSVHNTQPWLFHPRRGGIDVYADRDRQVPVIDPTERELLISVGAAVFNLRVAIRAHGRMPMQVVQPPSPTPDLMVRISPGAPAIVTRTARALAPEIRRRHSNRWPFADTALPNHVLAELATAATAEGATLRVLGRDARRYTLGLVHAAERQWRADPAYQEELTRWTRHLLDRRDGVPPAAYGPRSATGHLPLRDFGLTQPSPRREKASFEPSPTIAVLYTDDSPRQWLRAGQALQRTLLTATAHRVAAALMTQPLEIPWLRHLMLDPSTGQQAQVIIRLGYARRPGVPAPRRPLADFLRTPTSTTDALEQRNPFR